MTTPVAEGAQMRRWIYGQVYKFHFSIEREDKLFWWLPWWHGYIEREPFWQDYCNCLWWFDCGWLGWSLECNWQKVNWGWKQKVRGERNPLVRVWVDRL